MPSFIGRQRKPKKGGPAVSRSNFNDEQFVVSYELLKLLQWLVVNEQESLKKLLNTALGQGLKYELNNQRKHNKEDNLYLQESIIDFFTLMETLLHETAYEHAATNQLQRTMIPAIYHIDTTECDAASVAHSVAKATAAVENKTGENPKEVLCKELLRRWKPSKKPYAH